MSVLSQSSVPVDQPLPEKSKPVSTSPAPDIGIVPMWRCGVVLALALVAGLAFWFNPPMNVEPKAGVVMKLPEFVGDYYSKEGSMTQVEKNILPADTEMARRFYDDGRGHQLTCSIVLAGAEQRSIHRPEACLVGQGWTIVGQNDVPIQLPSGHKLVVRNLSLERLVVDPNSGAHLTVRAFYMYWFVGQNITTPSHFTRILLSNWDRVIHNRAHRWAYVSDFAVVTDNLQPNGLNADQTRTMMTDFIRASVPYFQKSEMAQTASN